MDAMNFPDSPDSSDGIFPVLPGYYPAPHAMAAPGDSR